MKSRAMETTLDYWQVEVVDDIKRSQVDRIHSLTTRLRFKHKALGCYLRAANAILPQWGFKQVEVSCDKGEQPERCSLLIGTLKVTGMIDVSARFSL